MNSPASSYGSDPTGLICAYHFRSDGVAWPMTSVDAEAWLAQAPAGVGFLWLHVNLSHSSCEKWQAVAGRNCRADQRTEQPQPVRADGGGGLVCLP